VDHLHWEFDAEAGDTIEVSLDRAANVQLLDPPNYELYRKKEPFTYFGGHATQTPVVLDVPADGCWHLVIDLGGGPGHVRASARITSNAEAV